MRIQERCSCDTKEMLFRLNMKLIETAFEIEDIKSDAINEYFDVKKTNIRDRTADE